MKTKPIASRIFQIVLFGNLVNVVLILAFAWWSLEKLESTAIEADRQIELDYFEHYGEKRLPHRVKTSQMISVFQPRNSLNPESLPIVFQNLPVSFQGEVEVLDKEYSVIIHEFPEGIFYLAKDLRLFEEQEQVLVIAVLMLATTIFLVSLGLAYVASQKISQPISRFTDTVSHLQSNHTTSTINQSFADAELNQMTRVINTLIKKINASVERERRFIAMASHELRTPITIIQGAANVLEKRERLDEEDRVTLQRILRTTREMGENTQALLELVRGLPALAEPVDIITILQQLKDTLSEENHTFFHRLELVYDEKLVIPNSNPVLARILVWNLVRNALQHTTGKVLLKVTPDQLLIQDEGMPFITSPEKEGDLRDLPAAVTGLGLYIVALASEALGWKVTISAASGVGNRISVNFLPDSLTSLQKP